MAIFASTTTSGYSDPIKAQSIKALEKRQADLMAQNAQSGAITPENTQTPIQGIGHVVNQLAGQMNEGRAMAAADAQRQALAQTMANMDRDNPDQKSLAHIAVAAPEIYTHLLTTLAENRRATQQAETQRYGYDKTAETAAASNQTTQRGQDIQEKTAIRSDETARAGQEQQGALARENMDVTRGEGAATRNLTRDMASQSQRAAADLAQAERDLKVSEAALERAHKTGTVDQQNAAATALEEVRARHQAARDASNNAFTASESEKQRAGVKENLHEQLNATKEGQVAKQAFDAAQQQLDLAFKSGDRDKVIAAAAEAAKAQQGVDTELAKLKIAADAAKPGSNEGKLFLDQSQKKVPEGTFEAVTGPKPGEVSKTIELQAQQSQRESMVDELKQAKELLGKGINTGLLKGFDTLRGQLPGGFLGDQAQSQRTEQFDSTMKKVATTNMSTILKGASTDFEMKEFIKQYNNPRVSMEDKRRAFERVLTAAEKDANFGAAAIATLPGAAKAGAGGGSAAAPADPLEGKIADGPDGAIIRRNGKWEKHGG